MSRFEKRREIWIHRDESTNELKICSDWGGGIGGTKNDFTKAEAKAIFNCVKTALEKLYPNVEINPWIDAKHGTID